MGIKPVNTYRVVDYLMSMHYAICHGPIDALIGIYIREKDAWPGKTKYSDDSDQDGFKTVKFKDFIASLGVANVPTSTKTVCVGNKALSINKPNLFGGNKREGGVKGIAQFLNGEPTQTMPSVIAAKYGRTPTTMPGFRGIASVFFYTNRKRGFLWGQNNPYLSEPWFTVFRRPKTGLLNQSESTIQVGNHPPDANPAHILYECLTNADWGMGYPETSIDTASFAAASTTLVSEKFGLSMIWNQQAKIEDFCKEVLDHIAAVLFVDPRTGLMRLKLIRGGYSTTGLKVFNPDNCRCQKRQRKGWGDVTNEVVISYTDPKNEKERSVTFQDIAAITAQGGTTSDARNYYGIRRADLAQQIGARDIRTAAYPAFSCEIEADRSAWAVTPGDVVKLDWPEDGINGMVLRVGSVDYGRPGEPTIKLQCIEDIFALDLTEYDSLPETGWTPPDEEPDPMAYQQISGAPYSLLAAAGFAETATSYPRVVPVILAQQLGDDTANFDLIGPTLDGNGNPTTGFLATLPLTPRSALVTALIVETTTIAGEAVLGPIDGDESPEVGATLLIGSGADGTQELATITAYNSVTEEWTITRGLLDTIPRAWPVGTPVWYVPRTFGAADLRERSAGQTVTYKLLPRTSLDVLPESEAAPITATLTDRPYRPYRPADVRVDGQALGPRVYGLPLPVSVTVTWANRNRKSEDVVRLAWDSATVAPEASQSTTLRVWNRTTNTLIATIAGLAGTSHVLPVSTFGGVTTVDLEVVSVRDGFESLQGYRYQLTL